MRLIKLESPTINAVFMFNKLLHSVCLSACLTLFSTQSSAYDAELNALLFESSELMQNGQIEEALVLLKGGEEKYSSSREFMNNLAVAYLGNSQPNTALDILRQLVDNDPLYSIIAHNLLEMELQITDAREEKIKPVLFIQTVESFFDEEAVQIQDSLTNSPRPAPEPDDVLPPIATEEPGLTVVGNRTQMAQDLVTLWASHWSAKNYDAYIAMYSSQFKGANGEDYRQWAEIRRSRLNKPGPISVRLSNIQVESLSEGQIRVTFDQRYTSSNYSDLVLKELIFVSESSDWKIITESTLATY